MLLSIDLEGLDFDTAAMRILESACEDAGLTHLRFDAVKCGFKYRITDEEAERFFDVQFCPTSEIPQDTLVGGLWWLNEEAPTVEIDGEEYTILRQW